MLYFCSNLRIADHTLRNTGEIKPAYSFFLHKVKREGDKLSLVNKSPLPVWQTVAPEGFDLAMKDMVPFVADFDLEIEQYGENTRASISGISDVKSVSIAVV